MAVSEMRSVSVGRLHYLCEVMEKSVDSKYTASYGISVTRNAAWLGLRFVVVTVIGLYSSRLVLASLGVVDYGVYAVVGSVIAVWGFLNTTMAGATSRFFAYELGARQGGMPKLFSAAMVAHLIIAGVVVAMAETAGLWFVETRLDIPEQSMSAARWVYQFAVLSAAVTIAQSPFTALVMAHERMRLFARVEILQSVLKLGVALSLTDMGSGRLVAYGAMSAAVAVIIAVVYLLICRRVFHSIGRWSTPGREVIGPLLSFSSFDLYGNLCVAGRTQGLEWLINIFFGVVYNAGAAVAAIVNNAVLGIASAVTSAFRPRIVKHYAVGDVRGMMSRLKQAVVMSGSVLALVAGPCFVETEYILALWLGDVPPAAADFARLLLIQSVVALVTTVVSMAIHATGRVKWLSIANGSLYLSTVVAVWVMFNCGATVGWAYGCSAAISLVAAVNSLLIAHRLVPSAGWGGFTVKVAAVWALTTLCVIPPWMLREAMQPGLPRLAAVTAAYCLAYGIVAWLVLLDNSKRHRLVGMLRKRELS